MTKLETQVFQDELDKKTLDTLLEMLDHIKINYISRQEYKDKKGNILKKTGGKDSLGEFYNLYLPDDFKVGEQVNIIYLLMNNFKLNKILLDPFLAKTKVMIGIILRANSELGTKELEDLQQKYQFTKDFINDLKNYTLKPDSKTREFIREIKGTSKNKLGSENKEKEEDIYGEKITQELDLTFFRKAINDIRTGLEILSQAEHEEIMNYIESENRGIYTFKKIIIDGIIIFQRFKKGSKELIVIRNTNFELESKKLRDKIGVDKLKIELEELRKIGDKEKIEEKELEIANILIKEIENSFHYILNGNDNGCKPLEIQKTKEIYCVGFSIIGHSLLSEFGIKHKGLQIPEHSALEIHIGKDKYYFDASDTFKKLHKIIKVEEQNGSVYKKYTLEGINHKYEAFSGDTEKILLAQIYNNKGVLLYLSKNYQESIKINDKALKLNIKNSYYYYNKGNALYNLKKYNEALEMYNKAIDLELREGIYYLKKAKVLLKLKKYKLYDLYTFLCYLITGVDFGFDIFNRNEKSKIRDFFKNKDFEGLKNYLLFLDKNE